MARVILPRRNLLEADAIPLWRHARYRPLLIQAIAAVAILAIVAWLAWTAHANLVARDIKSGFGFFAGRSGFQISPSLIAFDEASPIGRAFVVGLLNTLLVSAIALMIAAFVGVPLGAARTRPSMTASAAGVYVSIVRNVPPIVQLFAWYFVALRLLPPVARGFVWGGVVFLNNRGLFMPVPLAGPGLALCAAVVIAGLAAWIVLARRRRAMWGGGFFVALVGAAFLLVPLAWDVPVRRGFNVVGGGTLTPECVALCLTLGLYQAAYVAEAVRAGVAAVVPGQHEAAAALGLRQRTAFRLVVFPQALRLMLPPLGNIAINTVKASTLAAAIAYPDLVSVFAGSVLNITGQALEIMLVTAGVYLAVSIGLSLLLQFSDTRLRVAR